MPPLQLTASTTAAEVCDDLDLTGQRWLITGIRTGLGRESARVLASRGAEVIGLARTHAQAASTLKALNALGEPVACELSDLESIDAAVAKIRAGAELSGIVANAGIMALPTLQLVHGIERQLFVNHVGHAALITGLLDHLESAGRIVMVTSDAHRFVDGVELEQAPNEATYSPWETYGVSKLANLLFMRALTARGHHANAAHPGPARTSLARHLDDPEALYGPIEAHLKTIGQAAATQVLLAVRPELQNTRGKHFSNCIEEPASEEALDDTAAERLWTQTEALLKRLREA